LYLSEIHISFDKYTLSHGKSLSITGMWIKFFLQFSPSVERINKYITNPNPCKAKNEVGDMKYELLFHKLGVAKMVHFFTIFTTPRLASTSTKSPSFKILVPFFVATMHGLCSSLAIIAA